MGRLDPQKMRGDLHLDHPKLGDDLQRAPTIGSNALLQDLSRLGLSKEVLKDLIRCACTSLRTAAKLKVRYYIIVCIFEIHAYI